MLKWTKLPILLIITLIITNFPFSIYSNIDSNTEHSQQITSSNPLPQPATPPQNSTNPIQATLIHEQTTILPESPFWVAIHFKIDAGWHAYWKNPGAAGMPPEIDWDLTDGFIVETIDWPTPKKFILNSDIGYGYEDELVLLAKIISPKELPDSLSIKANVNWVACNNSNCHPGDAELSISLPTRKQIDHPNTEIISKARLNLPKIYHPIVGHKENGLITLKIEHENQIDHIQFFPEDSERVDESIDPIFTRSADQPNEFNIVLTDSGFNKTTEPLKGIIAFFETPNSIAPEKSIAINAIIHNRHQNSSQNTIAMNETNSRSALKNASTNQLTASTASTESIAASNPNPENETSLLIALSMAFLGGLILNLMPCVLPVISFKILSFVKMANQSRTLIFKHGVAFSLGVLFSFWVIAGLMLTLQYYGESIGWGFQLQNPLFVAILAAIILVFGLSMFGLFELGTGFATMAGQADHSNKIEGLTSSFLSGILATAVATPCTGPMLGTTVGLAVTLPTIQAMLLFSMIGIGMASPYLLLGAFPSLLKFVPKPGNWMVTFKEIIGFVMMITVLWLLDVFSGLTNSSALTILLFSFILISIACWIYGKWGSPIKKRLTRRISYVVAMAFLLSGGMIMTQAAKFNPHSEWIEFSPEKVAELQKKGIPVFIDYTAKWCLVCQANHLVLSKENVTNKFNEKGVVRMKADWTKTDPVITEALKKLGRNSVPVYVLYGTDRKAPPVILPQVLTADNVIEHLNMI